MNTSLIEKAEAYLVTGTKNNAPAQGAKDLAVLLGRRYNLPNETLDALALAALFQQEKPELVLQWLPAQGASSDLVQSVDSLLRSLQADEATLDLPQQILRDARYYRLLDGQAGADAMLKEQRKEWETKEGKAYDEADWPEAARRYWKQLRFYTGEAAALMGDTRREAAKAWKPRDKEEEKEEKKADKKDKKKKKDKKLALAGEEFPISGSKSVQMMFKTSLRNHIDLTNIADNKANIMLSINALIITILISLLPTSLQGHTYLLAPVGVLLASCVVSIIFATLATRPVKTEGFTNIDKIKTETTNLFFFGNFYKMNLPDYKQGMRQVIEDEELMENAIVTDLFFLGKALGTKFNRLRICYSVFMVGITLTVIAFAVAYSVH
ncbi:MAG: hypothetical protein HUU34_18055 [Saprospiraceae bacterium]|jgi:hypothetical protein|nr:hypothetical protein [Saprospiraceae bacterium]